MPLILAFKETLGELSTEDMKTIADINRTVMNLAFMNKLLKENNNDTT